MAKEKGKNIFGLFFLILVLFAIAFVAVSAVIMLFSPNKNLFGFQFVKGDGVKICLNATNSTSQIDLGNTVYDEINIVAEKADIVVQNNGSYEKSAVYITNNIRGYAKTVDAVDFEFHVEIEDLGAGRKALNIDITESEAFLYFSKDIKVVVNLNKDDDSAFANTVINAKTTSGDIKIGGPVVAGESADIIVKSVLAETKSGDISISKHAGNSFDKLNLITEAGRIDLTNFTEIKANNFSVDVANGKLFANKIDCDAYLAAHKGKLDCKEINGDVQIKAYSAIIDFGKVNGDVDFNHSFQIIEQCNVLIDEINGDFIAPKLKNSNLVLKSVGGNVVATSDQGNLTIGEKNTPLNANSKITTESGKINVVFGKDLALLVLKSNTGDITATTYDVATVANNIKLTSIKGDVKFNFNQLNQLKFTFAKEENMETPTFNNKNIRFDMVLDSTTITNPYYFKDSNKTEIMNVDIITSKKVYLDLTK